MPDFEVDPSFDPDAEIGSDTAPPAGDPAQTEAPWDWKPHYGRDVEYQASGKMVKEPFEMVLKRASQGYDYAQKVGDWNSKEKGFTDKITDYEAKVKQYEYLKEIDEYARQNPKWKEFLDNQWQGKSAFETGLDPNDKYLQIMNQKFDKMTELFNNVNNKVTQFDQFVTTQRTSKEDSELDAEVKSIRDTYPNLDWDARDEFGKTLEYKVLEHANKLGLGTNPGAFRAAFRDFNHDRLLAIQAETAKEKVADQAHALKKQGFIGKTPTPQTNAPVSRGIRQKSWDELSSEGLKEFGIQ